MVEGDGDGERGVGGVGGGWGGGGGDPVHVSATAVVFAREHDARTLRVSVVKAASVRNIGDCQSVRSNQNGEFVRSVRKAACCVRLGQLYSG